MHPDLLSLILEERARLRSVLRWELMARLLVAIAGLFWLGLLADRQLEPPPAARAAAYLVAAAATLVWLGRTTLAPLLTPINNEQMAGLIERARPEFRDSLLTAVSAPSPASDPADPVAAQLADATNQRALAAAATPGSRSVVSSSPARRWALAAAVGVASVAAYCFANPASAKVYASRLALSPNPWPRRVALELEGFAREEDGVWRRRFAAGDSVDLVVRADLSGDRINPRDVWLRYRTNDGQSGRTAMARVGDPTAGERPSQVFRHTMEDLRGGVQMSIRGGDARIEPVELMLTARPAILAVTAEITRPGYLGGGKRVAAAAAIGEIPAGADVRLTVEATRPLSALAAEWQDPSQPPITVGHRAGSSTAQVICSRLLDDAVMTLSIIDEHGIAAASPYPIELRVVQDRRPTVLLRPTTPGETVTPDASIELVAEIEDDYGAEVAKLTLEVDERPVAPRPLELGPAPRTRRAFSPTIDLLGERFAGGQSAGRLAVGQLLRVAAVAADGCELKDEDRTATSQTLSFRVVTPDTLLAEIERREADLRRTFEKTTEQLSRVARGVRAASNETGSRQIKRWLGEVQQATSETLAVGEAFQSVYQRLVANRIDNSDLLDRVGRQIAEPVLMLGADELPRLAARLDATPPGFDAEAAATLAESIEASMERLLAVMKSLETYNEVLAMLRQVIDGQDRLLRDTQRARRDETRRRLFD